MRQLLEFICSQLQSGRPVVSPVIVFSSGSTPRSSGCRMAVAADGQNQGTIGGGAVEAMVLREAKNAHNSRNSTLFRLSLSGNQAAEQGMICGGNLEILVDYIPADPENIECFGSLLARWDAGKTSVLCTAFRNQDRRAAILCRSPDPSNLPASVPDSLRKQVRKVAGRIRRAYAQAQDDIAVLVEPIRAPAKVLIAGAGHVGQATAVLAAQVGFDTVVMDDRPEFLSPERFPRATRLRAVDFGNCFRDMAVTENAFVVIVTRGHIHDQTVLAQALQTPAKYIGMIGSRKKRDAVYANLQAQGAAPADLERVCSPIGLDIGADTPEEIAVSIVAELIQIRARSM